jgi:hypothetical protein
VSRPDPVVAPARTVLRPDRVTTIHEPEAPTRPPAPEPRPPSYEAPVARPLVPPPVERLPAQARAHLDVHIGTIEIHPVDAVASAPTVAPALAPAAAGGFDEFLALRRYETWAR